MALRVQRRLAFQTNCVAPDSVYDVPFSKFEKLLKSGFLELPITILTEFTCTKARLEMM